MRAVVFMMSVSLDGYMSGPDGELDWHLVDDELHQHFNDLLARAGGFLDGRRTHELMAAYWPTADEDPASSRVEREFAGIWRETPKFVWSRTLEDARWNTVVLRELDPDHVRGLAAQPGGDLFLGGAELAATFREHDLIDEYRIYVHPVLIGRGRAAFHPTDRRSHLRLVETYAFGNGVTLLRYEVVRP